MANDHPPPDETASASSRPNSEFASPGVPRDEYTDGRAPWDWKTKYPPEARSALTCEAWLLGVVLFLLLIISGFFIGLATQSIEIKLGWLSATTPPSLTIDFRLLMIFFAGCLGGTTFSIKWLVHSAARGKWHLDRKYWRLFVPILGGV